MGITQGDENGMIDELIRASQASASALHALRTAAAAGIKESEALPLLREAVCRKLMIRDDSQNDIRKLIIMSIKRQELSSSGLPDAVIESRIRRYDCHQTSLVVQKKVLLFLFIEHELGIHLSDDEATEIETLPQLAHTIVHHMSHGGKEAGAQDGPRYTK